MEHAGFGSHEEPSAQRRCVDCGRAIPRRWLRCRSCEQRVQNDTEGMALRLADLRGIPLDQARAMVDIERPGFARSVLEGVI